MKETEHNILTLLNRDAANIKYFYRIRFKRWNFVLSGFSSYSESFRDGHYRNHFYLNNSKGKVMFTIL